MSQPDIPGRLLASPAAYPTDAQCWLRVSPIWDPKTGRTKALRVRVFTALGAEILNARATAVEITAIEVPTPDALKKDLRPGTMWFTGRDLPQDIGFLPDSNAGALLVIGARERPRKTTQQPDEGPT